MRKTFFGNSIRVAGWTSILFCLAACSNELKLGFNDAAQDVSERQLQVTIPLHLERSSRTGVLIPYVPTQSNSITVRVPYTVSGTAEYPASHLLQDGLVTFAPGSMAGELAFRIIPGTFEPSKTIVVTLGNPDSGILDVNSVHTVTVHQQAPAPVSFLSDSLTIAESAGSTSIPVYLSYEAFHDITVDYTITGTSSNPGDHNLASGTLTFPAGVTEADLDLTVVDDAIYEGDETLIVTLGTPSEYGAAGDITTLTATIVENDSAPTVDFSTASQTVSEPNGAITITGSLSQASALNTVVHYTVSGTTDEPDDHDLTDGTLTIPAGDTTADITINIVDDALTESNETIIVTMSSVDNATMGTITEHTITVIDDESAPIVNFSTSSQTVTEGVGTTTLVANLTHGTAFDVTVPYTVTGTAANPADHNLSNGSITILAGATTGSVTITVVNDTMDENDETIIATMGVPTNAGPGLTTVETYTITDNDSPPVADFTTSSQSVAESVGTVTVNMTLTAASSFDITVPYTISGTAANPADHDLAAGSFSILAGSTTANVSFNVVEEALYEANETVIVTMGVPTNASAGVSVETITINNNDTAPVANFSTSSQSILENAGTLTVTGTITAATGLTTTIPFTIGGTAANPADHNCSGGAISIAVGNTTGDATCAIVSDTRDENDETIVFTMGNPTNATKGATDVHTATITDDDPRPTVSFSAASQSVAETAGTVFVIVVLSAASSFDVSMPFTVGGTAVNPTNHDLSNGSISITSGNTLGQQLFTVTNDGVATGNLTVILTQGAPTNADSGTTTVHTVTILDAGRLFDRTGLDRWFSADRGIEKNQDNHVERWTPVDASELFLKPLEWPGQKKQPIWQIPMGSVWPELQLKREWGKELNLWSFMKKNEQKRVYWVTQDEKGIRAHAKDISQDAKPTTLNSSSVMEWLVFDKNIRTGGFEDVEAYLRGRYSLATIEGTEE